MITVFVGWVNTWRPGGRGLDCRPHRALQGLTSTPRAVPRCGAIALRQDRKADDVEAAERLEIERQCRELVLTATYHSDRGAALAALRLFAPDATWFRAGQLYTGAEEILSSYDAFSPTLVARHLIGTPLVSVIDSAHASSITYYTAFVRDPGTNEPSLPIAFDGPFTMGEWHDEFVRTPDRGWLFSSRATHRIFQQGDQP
jgi:hypothetical protein